MLVAQTDRLRLRHLTPDDAPFILELLNDSAWLQYIGDKNVRTLAAATDYITQGPMDMYRRLGFGLYLVEHLESSAPVGLCGLIKRDGLDDVDLGFALLERFRRDGFGLEAATAVMRVAAETLKLTQLAAITTPDNAPSQRLLTRLGFTFERPIVLPGSTTELRLYMHSLAANQQKRA